MALRPKGSRTDHRLMLVLRLNTRLGPVTVAARGCGAKNPGARPQGIETLKFADDGVFKLLRLHDQYQRPIVSPGSRNRPGWPHPLWGAIGDATRRLFSRADANDVVAWKTPRARTGRNNCCEAAALPEAMFWCSPRPRRIADVRAASTLHTRGEIRPFAATRAQPSRRNRQTSPGGMPVRLRTRPRHRM